MIEKKCIIEFYTLSLCTFIFVPLNERIHIANWSKWDIYISFEQIRFYFSYYFIFDMFVHFGWIYTNSVIMYFGIQYWLCSRFAVVCHICIHRVSMTNGWYVCLPTVWFKIVMYDETEMLCTVQDTSKHLGKLCIISMNGIGIYTLHIWMYWIYCE